MATDATLLRFVASFVLPSPRDCVSAQLLETPSNVDRIRRRAYPTMQKAMTQMNLQVHHVIADITGLTGMRIIRAIVGGERNRKKLASMRHERTHANEATIEKAS